MAQFYGIAKASFMGYDSRNGRELRAQAAKSMAAYYQGDVKSC